MPLQLASIAQIMLVLSAYSFTLNLAAPEAFHGWVLPYLRFPSPATTSDTDTVSSSSSSGIAMVLKCES